MENEIPFTLSSPSPATWTPLDLSEALVSFLIHCPGRMPVANLHKSITCIRAGPILFPKEKRSGSVIIAFLLSQKLLE